jgi:hypothetical protein
MLKKIVWFLVDEFKVGDVRFDLQLDDKLEVAATMRRDFNYFEADDENFSQFRVSRYRPLMPIIHLSREQ